MKKPSNLVIFQNVYFSLTCTGVVFLVRVVTHNVTFSFELNTFLFSSSSLQKTILYNQICSDEIIWIGRISRAE